MFRRFGALRIAAVVGLWIYLGLLIILRINKPSPLMNIVFNVGWVSLFVTGGMVLYRQYKEIKRRTGGK
jgi:hypothetical protein